MNNIGLLIGGALGAFGIIALVLTKMKISKSEVELEKRVLEAEKEKEQILQKARTEADHMVKDLRAELDKEHADAMKALRRKESEVEKRFSMVDRKQEKVDELQKSFEEKQSEIENQRKVISEDKNELQSILEKEKIELSKVSELSKEKATEMLLEKLKNDVEADSKALISRKIETANEEAEEKAREILMDSIQRVCHETTAEATTSMVNLPKEEFKGKIIGREGRNIRAFERVSGVDVIIDESQDVITLSCFDCFRREIAKRSMEKLIKDGRIHPQSIEETIYKTQEEMEEETRKIGEQTILEAGYNDVHPELIKVFGRLQFRHSYGQNQLQHAIQVMELTDYIAQELNLDRKLARRCGLLHDIGKAVDQGGDGTHPALGYQLANKYGENRIVCNAIAAHHEGVEVESIYTSITAVADAISAARPGARRENTEKYFERMSKLEEVASSFNGVSKAYAMRAGRELRVTVEAGKVDDQAGLVLARNIAKSVEQKVTYPGEVKVTLVRETRFVEFAR